MSNYNQTLQSNNTDLQAILNTINTLPEAGGSSDSSVLNALIDHSITEITSNATSVGLYAFYGCYQLTTANFPNATTIGERAFSGCYRLISADFPAVTDIGLYAFYGCYQLTTANFPNATTIGIGAFGDNYNLTTANFPNATTISSRAFNYCDNLTTTNFPIATSIGTGAFSGCYQLTTIDFPLVTSINELAFDGCEELTSLILRSETMCKLNNTNAFDFCYHILGTYGVKDGYIYVPKALIGGYRSATNWSAYATQFRAIEDYTVDGTRTGELDESKI